VLDRYWMIIQLHCAHRTTSHWSDLSESSTHTLFERAAGAIAASSPLPAGTMFSDLLVFSYSYLPYCTATEGRQVGWKRAVVGDSHPAHTPGTFFIYCCCYVGYGYSNSCAPPPAATVPIYIPTLPHCTCATVMSTPYRLCPTTTLYYLAVLTAFWATTPPP